ncbi:MAG TPA: DUF3604 domain-containing protein [Tepidisphaeraceae bacterium]|jgi:hypothetical protein|nr:DUF3604 domain-containing protein [Tepidisphaeraceae bacterium]
MHPIPQNRLGSATLSPNTPIIAGSTGTWTITLTVGSAGIDEGGTIKLAQRFASDFDAPQFDRPADPAYTTIRLNAEDPHAKLRPRYDRKGHDRPWMNCIVLDVYDGSLSPGDAITITLGDTSGGSPGMRAQTFQETAHEFRLLVDPTNACRPRPIAKSPTVPIIAGDPVELVCTLPTQAELNQPIRIHLKGQDKWGNPTPAPAGVKLEWVGSGAAAISNLTLTFQSPGTGVVRASSFTSNPITCHATLTKYNKYWGDLHAQSDATVGTGSEEEYFTFARDVAALDFCSHQGNDFQVRDQDWKKLNDVIRTFHKDHSFVAFPGWEWSGNSTVGGDRNVWYLEEDMPLFRSSHWQIDQPETTLSPADTADDLFERCRELPADKVLLGSHVGGRFADIRKFFDQDLGPLVELVSCWGVFEWMLWDAFDKNYIVGVMCNSDGHKGRPGAEGPGAGQFGIPNGLTCVLAEEQTRASIFKALKSRRCYGTTGARIDLDFTINDHPMGSVLTNAPVSSSLLTEIRGTAPLIFIDIYRGKEIIHTWRPDEFSSLQSSPKLRISWKGSRIRGRGRRVNWDGSIMLSDNAPDIVNATSHFDTPIDRITSATERSVSFISQTTGDTDWIDLTLSSPPAAGTLTFTSKAGNATIDLATLTTEQSFDFGGLDMQLKIERYPATLSQTAAKLSFNIDTTSVLTPYFVKVTQSDGQMAWSSPIYLKR